MKKTITINEAKLNEIISEAINEAIEEGFGDNFMAGVNGFRQGYGAQKMLGRGTEGFQQELSHEQEMDMANPWAPRPENTASEQAVKAYKQYLAYQQKANEMLNLYNKLTKEYDLAKVGVGQRANKNPRARGAFGGLNTTSPTKRFTKDTPIGGYTNTR